MYKLTTSAKDSDDLSIGFDCSRDRRQRELTNRKNHKRKLWCAENLLKDVYGFAEHQAKGTYGLGYKC